VLPFFSKKMNIMKKIICILVFYTQFFTSASAIELQIDKKYVGIGDTVQVNILTNSFTNVVSLQFPIKWNPEELCYLDGYAPVLTSMQLGNTATGQGFIRVIWVAQSDNGTTLPDSSRILTMKFRVLAQSGIESPIQVALNDLNLQFYQNIDGSLVQTFPNITNGWVKIRDCSDVEINLYTIDNQTIEQGDSVQLAAFGASIYYWESHSMLWVNPFLPIQTDAPTADTQYIVRMLRADGCFDDDTITVTVVQPAQPPAKIINAFTPNGDGINDFWVFERLENIQLAIFDANGIMVFFDANYQNDWDGKSPNGTLLPEGGYFYILKTFSPARQANGVLHLIR
jgi:gliding motility-associated-like protein